jgi:flagellar hook-length control protein FliK
MHRLDPTNSRTKPSLPTGSGAKGRTEPGNPSGSLDPFATFLKTRLSSAPAQELLSSEAVRAPWAQESPGARRSKVGTADVAGCADLSAIAAQELGQRGDTRLTVAAATKSAQTPGEQNDDLAEQHGDEPELADADGKGTNRPRAAGSADVRFVKGNAPADQGDAGLDGADVQLPSNNAVKDQASPSRANERNTDAASQKQGATAAGGVAQASMQAGTAGGAIAAGSAATAASMRADAPAAGTTSSSSVQPVSGVTATGRADSGRKFQVPKGPADPRGAHAPEEGAETAAPGVKGQAMRGVFAILRGTQSGTSAAVIRLTPENLGELKISLSMAEGKLSAILGASNEQARADLEASVPELREALHGRGILVESIEVRREPERPGERDGGQTPDPGASEQDSTGLAGDSRSGSPDERDQHSRAGAGRDDLTNASGESAVITGEESPVVEGMWINELDGGWNAAVDLTA